MLNTAPPVVWRQLRPTASHRRRCYFWRPAAAAAGDWWLGSVTACQGPAAARYLIDRDDDRRLPRGWRAYLLARQDGPITDEREGVYRVVLDHFGRAVGCSCLGARGRGPRNCVHQDVVEDLFNKGDLT